MIVNIKENLKELLSFLKNPGDKADSNQKVSHKVKQLASLAVIDIALMIAIIWPVMSLVEETGLVDTDEHAMEKVIREAPVWLVLILAVLLAPLVEELIFRTFLTFRRNYPLRLVIALAGLGGLRSKAKVRAFLQRNWRKHYRVFFYSMAAFFAFVHIYNYELSAAVWLLLPFLVLPQLIAGLLLGYMRVRYGLLWSMYLHGIHNLIFVGLSLWLLSETVEKLDLKTEAYEIKIEEAGSGGLQTSSSTTGCSRVSFTGVKMEEVLLYLLDKDEPLLEIADAAKAELLLNIHFTTDVDTLNNKQLILGHLQQVYGMEISREDRSLPYYDLQLADSLLLYRHRSLQAETLPELQSTVNSFQENLEMENIKVSQLVESLNKKIEAYILYDESLEGLYNFKLSTGNFEGLQQRLLQEYGLSLIKKEGNFECISVAF